MIVKKSSLLSIFALIFLLTESNTVDAKIVSGMCFIKKTKNNLNYMQVLQEKN